MIILDAEVLSALMQQTPDKNVIVRLDKQPRTSVWTSSVTIMEVRFGLQILPLGKRRSLLIQSVRRCSRQDSATELPPSMPPPRKRRQTSWRPAKRKVGRLNYAIR
jgi:hypothetical protein